MSAAVTLNHATGTFINWLVLQAFAMGMSVPQVAAELFLGVSTIKTHTQRLYEKLGVSDRAAAVAEGMRRGLVE